MNGRLTKDQASRVADGIARLSELAVDDLQAMIEMCIAEADKRGRAMTAHLLAMAKATLDAGEK